MTLYVLCGIPGSGKTTLSKQYNAKLYCYDEYKKRTPLQERDKTHERMFSNIRQSLLLEQDVIVDDLYLTKEWRDRLLSSIKDIECKKILIVLQTPIEVCIERDKNRKTHNLGEHVICHLNNRYQPPSLDEGWDDIIFIENN